MYLWREGLRIQFMDSAARAQSTQRLGRAEFLAFLEAFFCGFLFGLLHVVPPVSEIALRGRSNLDGPSCARRKGKSSESKNDMECSSEIRSFDAKRRWTIAAVRRRLFAVDDAVFHDEGYFLQCGDVVEGIAGDGDDVGEVAGLERADLVFPLQ